MTRSTSLERRYRRLLALYPGAFRAEHEEEIVAVLIAGTQPGQSHPGPAESLDLVWNAARVRALRIRGPQPSSVAHAVWLLCLAAALELVCLVTVSLTQGDLHAAILRSNPGLTAAQWHSIVHTHVVSVQIGAPIAACLWLLLAWATRRGYRWARSAAAVMFALTSAGLLAGLSEGAPTLAPADAIAGTALWATALAAILLLISDRSRAYYRSRQPA